MLVGYVSDERYVAVCDAAHSVQASVTLLKEKPITFRLVGAAGGTSGVATVARLLQSEA